MHTRRIVYTSAIGLWFVLTAAGGGGAESSLPGGALHILDQDGPSMAACPLKHTDVEADISGFVARVRVRQTFHNPLERKIEAIYVFPLPQDAAVNELVMTVGKRRIVGQIKPRGEARAAYEAARAAGHVASLLDQERPNIFTQAVTNIEPGAQVVIELSYVETLRYDAGVFEFVFPMVVGPRYMPGSPTGRQGTGWAPDTTQVPDASRISPPVALPGTRAGHDISMEVHIDAGVPVFELQSVLHAVDMAQSGPARARVALKNQAEIPNRDFILRYRTATDAIGDAFLTHTDARGTFFTLILQPPRVVRPEHAVPKELIFVIDRSGSMSGFPIGKAKETMRLAIERMNPHDTFNLLSFSGGTGRCFTRPVPNTAANRAIALKYLADLYGSGGTEMMPAIREALGERPDPGRVRVIAFMTDGYVGNDVEIIDTVRKHAGTARVFAFGIGNAVNRFLLDGMVHAGRGAVDYVTLESRADEAVERFQQRIHTPLLTDITIDWGKLSAAEVYPKHLPDLFSHQPIMLHGRLQGPADGTIVLHGRSAAGPFARQIRVHSPAEPARHAALAALWGRAKVKERLQQDYTALQRGTLPEAFQQEITALGVEFQLVTQFTSFVAVEEMTLTVAGQPMTLAVPVDIPAGVSYQGVFGQDAAFASTRSQSVTASSPVPIAMKSPAHSGRSVPAEHLVRQRQEEMRDAIERDPSMILQAKLAEPLRGLDERVANTGKEGNLTLGKLRVVYYRVDVIIYLRDTSPQAIDALKQLGFAQTSASHTTRLLIGSIDVRRLAELAQLDVVIHIAPVVV